MLEELLQEEIIDETDMFIDNLQSQRVNAAAVAGALPPRLRQVGRSQGGWRAPHGPPFAPPRRLSPSSQLPLSHFLFNLPCTPPYQPLSPPPGAPPRQVLSTGLFTPRVGRLGEPSPTAPGQLPCPPLPRSPGGAGPLALALADTHEPDPATAAAALHAALSGGGREGGGGSGGPGPSSQLSSELSSALATARRELSRHGPSPAAQSRTDGLGSPHRQGHMSPAPSGCGGAGGGGGGLLSGMGSGLLGRLAGRVGGGGDADSRAPLLGRGGSPLSAAEQGEEEESA